MTIEEFLVGRKVNYITDAKVPVQLEIKSFKEMHHSRDVGPSNAQNDWWPEQATWTTFEVEFIGGFSKSYNSIFEIDLVK